MPATVIIPTYNDGPRVRHAVLSALALACVERVIVVDDGSEPAADLGELAGEERVDLVRQGNAGVAVARNVGVERATSDWLVFLDADDVLLAGVGEAIDAGERAGAALVLSGGFQIMPDGSRKERRPPESFCAAPLEDPADIFRQASRLCLTGVIVRRAAVNGGVSGSSAPVRFDPEMRTGQDTDFIRRIAEMGPVIHTRFLVGEQTVHAHRRGSNISSRGNIETRAANWLRLYDRWYHDRAREDWCKRLTYWTRQYARHGADRAVFERLRAALERCGGTLERGWAWRFAARRVARGVGLRV